MELSLLIPERLEADMLSYAQAMAVLAEPGTAVKRAWWAHFICMVKGQLMMYYGGRLMQYTASEGDLDAADWMPTTPSIGIHQETRRAS